MKHSGSRNGRDRGSFLLSYVGVRGRDPEASTEGLTPDRLAGLVRGAYSTPAASTMNADAQHAETEAAERARAATEAEAADESSNHELAVPVSAITTDEGQSTAVVGDAGAADVGSVVDLFGFPLGFASRAITMPSLSALRETPPGFGVWLVGHDWRQNVISSNSSAGETGETVS